MKNKLLILSIFGLILAGVSAFIYPAIKAQISQTETKHDDEASLIVNSQPVSNTFYEGLKENQLFKSSGLKLTKASFIEQNQGENMRRIGPFEKWYVMDFQNDNFKIKILIEDYKSQELASEVLNKFWYSQGYIESTKEFGDEGIKVFYAKGGKLDGIRFRKDRFNIYISCKSEELLKVFAENALKAIEGK